MQTQLAVKAKAKEKELISKVIIIIKSILMYYYIHI